jgi:fructokinase
VSRINPIPLFGGIEGGGTKYVCAVGTSPDDIRALVSFPTTDPHTTIQKVLDFFHQTIKEHGPLAAVGLASFGPVDLNPASPTFGHITNTPKPGWANVDILGPIKRGLDVKTIFDMDVNAAALAEWHWGAGKGLDSLVYLTVGTGIGGGIILHGKVIHGLVHPEMGHLRVPHDRTADPYAGCCPFHADCLEGLASGPALEKRWGRRAEDLPVNHPGWELEAGYLAVGISNLILTLSPERIIVGGGVMRQSQLFPLIHEKVKQLLAGYVGSTAILEKIDGYIVPPALGDRVGVLGAISMAKQP